jgi:hypothetical protein
MSDYSKILCPDPIDTWRETQRLQKLLEPVVWTNELEKKFQVWTVRQAEKMDVGDGVARRWGKTYAEYLYAKMRVDFCQAEGLIK